MAAATGGRLSPNISGSYLNGRSPKLAPLPDGYAPLYFASAVLPDGRVIIERGIYINGQEVRTNLGAIYDPLSNKCVQRDQAAAGCRPAERGEPSAYYGFMIVLPTGQVMFNSRLGDIELFTETSGTMHNAAPVITSAPTSLVAGKSYLLSGKQLNGLSQGTAYSDGYQPATNYPLVRIVNAATKYVFYARTSGHSSRSVTPGAIWSTHFTIPAGIETGPRSCLRWRMESPLRPFQ